MERRWVRRSDGDSPASPVSGFWTNLGGTGPVQSGTAGGRGGRGGLEQRAGRAAGQRQAEAVRRTRAHRQQVVVARDVAVPGQVVRVLRVPGNQHAAGPLHHADAWFWEGGFSQSDCIFSLLLLLFDN